MDNDVWTTYSCYNYVTAFVEISRSTYLYHDKRTVQRYVSLRRSTVPRARRSSVYRCLGVY
jgi:hypothetical protein